VNRIFEVYEIKYWSKVVVHLLVDTANRERTGDCGSAVVLPTNNVLSLKTSI
jgi:hypothetical protein